MHPNRNKKMIKRVGKGMMKANRSRNFFAVMAIVLTTFMITSVFSLALSFKENFDLFSIRQAGTTATINLKKPTEEQYEKIKSLDYLDSVGRQIFIGNIDGSLLKNEDLHVPVMWYDETEWNDHFKPAISNVNGRYPHKAHEVMMSEEALKQLGIDKPEEGQKVKLSVNGPGGTETAEYSLSGWFRSYGSGVKCVVMFSEQYCAEHDVDLEEYGTIYISAKDQSEAYDLLEKDVELKPGQEFDSYFGEDDMSDTIQTIALLVMIIVFIMLSGFLLIYNVFYISVSREINQYGMLKTIGTSRKQIRKIIMSQALRLACIGIPTGLVLSAAASFILVPLAMRILHQGDFDKVSFSPVIFIGAAVFSLATVLISAWKPAGKAGKISPIEALRYNSVKSGSLKKKKRSSRNGAKASRMAWRNIFRNKKQTILVVISLFLGSITMLSINGIFGSINTDNYADEYVKKDYAFVNEAPIEDEFTETFISGIKNTEGVTEFVCNRAAYADIEFDEEQLRPVLEAGFEGAGGDPSSKDDYDIFLETMRGLVEQGEYGTWLHTVDTDVIRAHNEKHEDKIDEKAFERGEIVLGLGSYDDGVKKGMELTLKNSSGDSITPTVGGSLFYEDIDYMISVGHPMGTPEIIFVSDKFMDSFDKNAPAAVVSFNVDSKYSDQVAKKVELLSEDLAGATYTLYDKEDIIKDFDKTMKSLGIIGNTVSIFLIIIGVLNFINLMMTGIYARRHEFAVMQSIGTTNRQIRGLLRWEGLYYALITTVLIAVPGNAILMVVAKLLPSMVDYAVFQYPVASLVILLACIYALCMAVPFIVYRYSAKATITERLRNIEN